jgi:hypothetical protein
MYTIYIDKYRYEIQEQKEVPVWYTDPFRVLNLYEASFVIINQSLASLCMTRDSKCSSVRHGPWLESLAFHCQCWWSGFVKYCKLNEGAGRQSVGHSFSGYRRTDMAQCCWPSPFTQPCVACGTNMQRFSEQLLSGVSAVVRSCSDA